MNLIIFFVVVVVVCVGSLFVGVVGISFPFAIYACFVSSFLYFFFPFGCRYFFWFAPHGALSHTTKRESQILKVRASFRVSRIRYIFVNDLELERLRTRYVSTDG